MLNSYCQAVKSRASRIQEDTVCESFKNGKNIWKNNELVKNAMFLLVPKCTVMRCQHKHECIVNLSHIRLWYGLHYCIVMSPSTYPSIYPKI